MNIKKIILSSMATLSIFSAMTAVNASGIKVFVDNSEVTFSDQAPEMLSGRTLVPVRAVFEKAGATVSWDADTQTALLEKDDYNVSVKLGEAYLMKNGVPIALDVPACMLNDRLSIPVRAIAEAMDFAVTWNSTRSSVLINTTGKQYRANSQWKTGFTVLSEAGTIIEGRVNDLTFFDLDGDEENDTIGFIPSSIREDGTVSKAAVWIKGAEFTNVLNSDLNAYAIGVADINEKDKYKELVVLYNTDDGKCAGFYRFNGSDLFQLKANNSDNGMVYFHSKLFVDGCENVISDEDGLCFLNDMICTGVYSLEDGALTRYLWNPDNTVGKTYKRIYQDNIPLSYKETSNYKKGHFVSDVVDNDVIYSDDLAGFEILDYYVDDQNPSNYEFFISLPNGTKAVIWPYTV